MRLCLLLVKQPIIENDTTILIKELQVMMYYMEMVTQKVHLICLIDIMAGDWRQYYFDVQNELVNTAVIEFSWELDDTNLAVFAMDPSGKIIQTNVPSGVFVIFLDGHHLIG